MKPATTAPGSCLAGCLSQCILQDSRYIYLSALKAPGFARTCQAIHSRVETVTIQDLRWGSHISPGGLAFSDEQIHKCGQSASRSLSRMPVLYYTINHHCIVESFQTINRKCIIPLPLCYHSSRMSKGDMQVQRFGRQLRQRLRNSQKIWTPIPFDWISISLARLAGRSLGYLSQVAYCRILTLCQQAKQAP